MKVITMSNDGGMEMAKNLLTSIEKVGIPLSQVLLYKLKEGVNESVNYSTEEFNRLMIEKIRVILDALNTNETVLWVDSDIVFLKNCLSDIEIRGSLSEMCLQAQITTFHFCAGFMYIKSTDRNKSYLLRVIDLMKQRPDWDDEVMINTTFFQAGMNFTSLPYLHYPVGRAFFNEDDCIRPVVAKHAYIVHNNFIVGNDAKIERFKKNGLWNVDDTILSRVETRIWKCS